MRKPAPDDGDRRQHIVEAALDIFSEHGFEKATTKEIATSVGVAQGLVYFYFASKVELLFAACEHQTRLALAQLDALEAEKHNDSPQVALRNVLTHIVTVLDEPRNARLLRLIALTNLPEKDAPASKSSAGPAQCPDTTTLLHPPDMLTTQPPILSLPGRDRTGSRLLQWCHYLRLDSQSPQPPGRRKNGRHDP